MSPGVFDDFVCDACHARMDTDLLCRETSDACSLSCVHCCTCPVHTSPEDMEGTVIWSWRGLDGSEHRTRRH